MFTSNLLRIEEFQYQVKTILQAYNIKAITSYVKLGHIRGIEVQIASRDYQRALGKLDNIKKLYTDCYFYLKGV